MSDAIDVVIARVQAKREKLNDLLVELAQLRDESDVAIQEAKPRIERRGRPRKGLSRSQEIESRAKAILGDQGTAKNGNAESADENSAVRCTSPGAMKIANSLQDPFTATDLRARLDGEPRRAYSWIYSWQRKGWIETVGVGSYRKTASFGKD